MKIALLGDLALFGNYSIDNPDIFNYFEAISKYLESFDLVIANLETPLLKEKRQTYGSKSAHICAESKDVRVLEFLNIDVVNLSNNHIFDYGKKGYFDTINTLKKAGIKYFGGNGETTRILFDNNKLSLSGYTCLTTNPLRRDKVNLYNIKDVQKVLKKDKEDNFFTILSVHAGEEHVTLPNYTHLSIARELSEDFDFVYYGHHPHVIQGVETINNSLLAYSLGNFCFDDVKNKETNELQIKQSVENKKGLIVELEIENNKLVNHKLTSVYQGDNHLELFKNSIKADIIEYSKSLKYPKEVFIEKRVDMLKHYIDDRKSKRSFSWYLKRLKLKYIILLLNAYLNRLLFHLYVKRYLKS